MTKLLTFIFSLFCSVSFAQVVINEVLFNSINGDGVNGSNGEWVEIYNSGSTAVDIGGWWISDGDWSVEFNTGTTIAPGDWLVIGYSATAENAVVDIDVASHTLFGSGRITLTNTSEYVSLFDATNTLVEGVKWGNPTDTTVPNPAGGADLTIDLSTFLSASSSEGDGESISRDADGSGTFVLSNAIGGNSPGTSNAALPIELVYFHGELVQRQPVLHWSTASETNNELFVIEHSRDGQQFVELSRVHGAGTTYEKQEYHFTHATTQAGLHYYRLRQVDFDGRFTYSHIEVVELENMEQPILVYPTIASQQIQVEFHSSLKQTERLFVFDLNGRLVLQNTIAENTEVSTIDIASLPRGTYLIGIETDGAYAMQRFLKTD